VDYARSLGLDVVITDHHHCKDGLPEAVAVVDPRRPDCGYPFPELAGVGVALKLALALTPEPDRRAVLERYVELAAIGTVADVMKLTGENRAIVRMGLERLSRTKRPGLRSLLQEVAPNQTTFTAVNIGYGLAPRINAAGRMEQAEVALELLLTRDTARGQELAHTLCDLNRQRQAIELAIYEDCTQHLAQHPEQAGPSIVLAGEGWHQGVVGIVASRLAEQHACPAFMICLDQGRGKGSCRSFGGFDLFAALEQCAGLLEGYGGHQLAAGFTIQEKNIPAFKQAMDALVSEYAASHSMASSLDVDVDIDDCSLLTVPQVDALSALEPFGTGNPKPVFRLQGAVVSACADVGGGRHLKLRVRRDGYTFDAIFFSANSASASVCVGDRVDLAFTPQINEYRGRRDLQFQLCDLRHAPTRAQAEQALYDKLCAGVQLTAREAALLLPERADFAHLWRFLKQTCSAGPAQGPVERLARSAAKAAPTRRSYGRTMVCFRVLDERGLIQVERHEQQVSVSLCAPEQKVDLEQSEWMKKLRGYLES
jgi:single-stranded-DNA-specific exonuclease